MATYRQQNSYDTNIYIKLSSFRIQSELFIDCEIRKRRAVTVMNEYIRHIDWDIITSIYNKILLNIYFHHYYNIKYARQFDS